MRGRVLSRRKDCGVTEQLCKQERASEGVLNSTEEGGKGCRGEQSQAKGRLPGAQPDGGGLSGRKPSRKERGRLAAWAAGISHPEGQEEAPNPGLPRARRFE